MMLTSPLLNLSSSLNPHLPSSTSLHASNYETTLLRSLPISKLSSSPLSSSLTIRANKKMQGRVVVDVSDKTVAVEVFRLAPHPLYHRRVRIKKRYQCHDPENKFKVGDIVELQKIRPISKKKTFLAFAVPPKVRPPPPENAADAAPRLDPEDQTL